MERDSFKAKYAKEIQASRLVFSSELRMESSDHVLDEGLPNASSIGVKQDIQFLCSSKPIYYSTAFQGEWATLNA